MSKILSGKEVAEFVNARTIKKIESLKRKNATIDSLLEKGNSSYGGTILPVVKGTRKILN